MGAFYVNVCISDYPVDDLVQRLAGVRDKFLVGPQVNGWSCIISEQLDMQDWNLLDAVCKGLTKGSARKAFGVMNHDDDILSADVWVDGEMVGAYNSCPGYFKEDATEEDLRPRLRNVEVFAALGSEVSAEMVQAILVPPEGVSRASKVHSDLGVLVGLPAYSFQAAFRYVSQGETTVEWRPAGAA